MNRVECFRQRRRLKLKITFSFFVFLTLIFGGISVADYSVNSILRNENAIAIVSAKEVDNTCLQISIMNKNLYINTKYIKRDYKRLKDFIQNKI